MPPRYLSTNLKLMLPRENKIDIIALNETTIDEIVDDSFISIDGYFHERHDRNRHGSRVLIYIKDTITYERLQNDDTKLCDLATLLPRGSFYEFK